MTTATATAIEDLRPGDTLATDFSYASASGPTLMFQPDGNLCLRGSSNPDLWGLHHVFRKPNGSIDREKCLKAVGGTAQFDVSGALLVRDASGAISWTTPQAGAGARLTVENNGRLALRDGAGKPVWGSNGWRRSSTVTVGSTIITVLASRDATDTMLDAVTRVYTEMMTLLSVDRSQMNGFSIYMVNDEPWETELEFVRPINAIDEDGTPNHVVGDQTTLRGGMCWQFCWIDEAIICRTAKRDNLYRGYDQPIHEFAHGIGERCKFKDATGNINAEYRAAAPGGSACDFAWAVQGWFGASWGTRKDPATEDVAALLKKIFSGRATFDTTTGKPTRDPVL